MRHDQRLTLPKLEKRLDLLQQRILRETLPLQDVQLKIHADDLLVPGEDGLDQWHTLEPYRHWGPRTNLLMGQPFNFSMRTTLQIPGDWQASASEQDQQEESIALQCLIGDARDPFQAHPEALLTLDDQPFAATDRHHTVVTLPEAHHDLRARTLTLEGWSGLVNMDSAFYFQHIALVRIHEPLRAFVATARVALDAVRHLSEDDPTRARLLNALDSAFNQIDLREAPPQQVIAQAEAFYQSIAPAHARLQAGLERAGASLPVSVYAIGHAHIDVAWLWTLAQAHRKAARTFHTVLHLMERYPAYRFSQSQPYLYDVIRREHPALFERIRQRVAEQRWEPLGGMWLEADCNLSGAEPLARQFLLGRTFFREHFGENADSPILWLPDAFGYNWQLPQLMREAGLRYFFSIKLRWNQYFDFPYDSFWWQGLDGSRVLAHFSTTPEPGDIHHRATYNADATATAVLGSWRKLRQKDVHQDVLMSYGWGDGGGGPTPEMLDNLREMVDFPGLPQVTQTPARDFFRALENDAGERLPIWNDELYLEYHRGTYTAQAQVKRDNRRAEFALHDLEFLAALVALRAPETPYPYDELNALWRTLCLNQFHDILPGSSIAPVYDDSREQFRQLFEQSARLREAALATLRQQFPAAFLAINPTSFPQHGLITWPEQLDENQTITRVDGQPVLMQALDEGGTLLDVGRVPAYSLMPLQSAAANITSPLPGFVDVESHFLENDFLRVELNDEGDIIRLYDKQHEREILPPGARANQLQAFEDRPLNWDAWDIDIFYEDKLWLAEPAEAIEVVAEGPLRVTIEIRRRIRNSPYRQRISLDHHSRVLHFELWIDWRERQTLLKTAFPVAIHAPRATYEIQWGHIQRPTHRSTPRDLGRFEVPAQKWADLSEGDYGVSLINADKYGHDIHGHVMRLSLLTASTWPDARADLGEHHIRYGLLPHAGSWQKATLREAYAYNDPLILAQGQTAPDDEASQPWRFLRLDRDNIVVETIKRAEDGQGFVIRLYEAQRQRGTVTLNFGWSVAEAWRSNLLEDKLEALDVHDNALRVSFSPHQIISLRVHES